MTMERTLEPNGAVPTVPGTLAWSSGRMRCWARSASVPSDSALAGQHQVADRHAAGVHAHDLRRQHARRHGRLRPVGLGDHLGHRLRHVGAGIERQLDEGDLLDALRLDVLDAVDVLEVQLELVDDQPFHLGRAHAVEVLDDVDLRQVEGREDIDAHAENGQHPAADQRDHHHQHGDRVAHREVDGVHGVFLRFHQGIGLSHSY